MQQPSLFSNTAPSIFSATPTQNAFGMQMMSTPFGMPTPTGSTIKFVPLTGTDTMQKAGMSSTINTKHMSITCMKEYEGKSFEEIRFEDFQCDRKGISAPPPAPQFVNPTPMGSTPTPSPSPTTSLFGSADKHPTAFGQQPSTPTNLFSPSVMTTPTFGQSAVQPTPLNTFGSMTTPIGGVPTGSTSLFGKPNTFGVVGSSNAMTSAFGSTSNQTSSPFGAPPQPKQPFTLPTLFGNSSTSQGVSNLGTQNTFGSSFGQPAQHLNQSQTSLFSKPATVPAFGSTNQGGFVFNSSATQQPASSGGSFFQPKPTSAPFGLFSQPSTLGTFNTSNNTLTQPQTSSLFGNVQQPKLNQPSLFGNTSTFNSQSTPLFNTTMNAPAAPIQVIPYTPDPVTLMDYRHPSFRYDVYPQGPHSKLVPLPPPAESTTDPKQLKAIIELHRNPPMLSNTPEKIKVTPIRYAIDHLDFPSNEKFKEVTDPNRSTYKRFMAKPSFKSSYVLDYEDILKELDIKSDKTSTVSLFQASTFSVTPSSDCDKYTCDSFTPATTESSNRSVCGVIMTKPEYYTIPDYLTLDDYVNADGQCIVDTFTVGRRGYGNIFFSDSTNITSLNIDDTIHFRHKEVIVYPDESKKPPVSQGLNKPALVTLNKVYPRKKGCNEYVSDPQLITDSGFADRLIQVTLKHDCKFVEYGPETGSWVFQVKHFSKYAFTESDEEDCALPEIRNPKRLASSELQSDDMDNRDNSIDGESGMHDSFVMLDVEQHSSCNSSDDFQPSLVNSDLGCIIGISHNTHRLKHHVVPLFDEPKSKLYAANLAQTVKLTEPLLTVGISTPPQSVTLLHRKPKNRKIKPLSPLIHAKITMLFGSQCLRDINFYKGSTTRVGWSLHGKLYFSYDNLHSRFIVNSAIPALNTSSDYEGMLPSTEIYMPKLYEFTRITYGNQIIPTARMPHTSCFLDTMVEMFRIQANFYSNGAIDNSGYLHDFLHLCSTLWKTMKQNTFHCRQRLSNWFRRWVLRRDAYGTHGDNFFTPTLTAFRPIKSTELILNHLTAFDIVHASNAALSQKLPTLGLLIAQVPQQTEFMKALNTITLRSFDKIKRHANKIDYTKIYMLLSGLNVYKDINVCKDFEWQRAFAIHLWYLTPALWSLRSVIQMFENSFNCDEVKAPLPDRCTPPSTVLADRAPPQRPYYHLLFEILKLFVEGNYYNIAYILEPITHADCCSDYRFSWIMLQVFESLGVGIMDPIERRFYHLQFAAQLEQLGKWQWAVFVLLFLKDNKLKYREINRLLDMYLESNTRYSFRTFLQAVSIPRYLLDQQRTTVCQRRVCMFC